MPTLEALRTPSEDHLDEIETSLDKHEEEEYYTILHTLSRVALRRVLGTYSDIYSKGAHQVRGTSQSFNSPQQESFGQSPKTAYAGSTEQEIRTPRFNLQRYTEGGKFDPKAVANAERLLAEVTSEKGVRVEDPLARFDISRKALRLSHPDLPGGDAETAKLLSGLYADISSDPGIQAARAERKSTERKAAVAAKLAGAAISSEMPQPMPTIPENAPSPIMAESTFAPETNNVVQMQPERPPVVPLEITAG